MSNQISLFENSQFGSVRVIMRGEDPWFVAKDVAVCLGYSDPKRAVYDHCKKVELLKGVDSTPLTNSPRGISIIPESDLYRLIMRSHLPNAEAFQDWVVEEVLPQIRKTGSYSQAPQTYLEALKQCVALEEARLAAEALAKEKQLALEQEQAAHEDTLAELGRAKQFRSCLAMGEKLSQWFNIKYINFEGDSFYSQLGVLMTMLCNGGHCGKLFTNDPRFCSTTFQMIKEHVPNSRFGYINAYDMEAWNYFFDLCSKFNPATFPRVKTFAR